jgi:hypothetical protein
MPSRWLRNGPNKLKKCSERRTDSCSTETDGCCSVIACTYCLEFAGYEGTRFGQAEFPEDGTGWEGTIAGAAFFGSWERNEDAECEFVVTLDGEEVYRKSCYEGQSCRDSSDSAEVTIGYADGTLTWTKQDFRPLPLVNDPQTGCRTWFCGDCHCTCEVLCASVTEPDGRVIRGELPDVSYSDCEGPVWAGMVGEYELSVELGRDEEDGSCIARVTTNGEESEWVEAAGCQSMSATWTLYDGTEIAVVCKGCDCNTDTPIDLPFCLCSPVGSILNFTMIGSGTGVCAFSGELTYQEEAILPTWISAPFTLPTKPTATEVTLRLFCDSTAGSLFPANGFTEEDAAEVNTAFWYSVGLYPTSGEGPRTTIPHYYRQPDDILGWVGRCRDGFFLVVRYLNDICGSVGDGLVTVVITE